MSPNPPTTPSPSSPTRRPPSTRRSSPAHAGSTAHIPTSDPPIRTGSRSTDNISRSHSFHDAPTHAIDERIRHYLEDQARLVHQMQRASTADSTASHRSPTSSKAGFVEAVSRMGSGVASPPRMAKIAQSGVLDVMQVPSASSASGSQGVSGSSRSTNEGPPAKTVSVSGCESPPSADPLSERLTTSGNPATGLLDSNSSRANAHSVFPSTNMLTCPFISGTSGLLNSDASTNLHPAASGAPVSASIKTAAMTPRGKPGFPPARPKHKHSHDGEAARRINEVIDHVSESLEQLSGSSPNLEQAVRQTMMVVTSPTVSSLPRAGSSAKEIEGGDVVAEQFQLGTVQHQQLGSAASGPGGGNTLHVPPPVQQFGGPIFTPLNGKPGGASFTTLDRRSRGRLQSHPPNGALEHQRASMSWNARFTLWLLCVATVVGTSAYASWNAGSIANRYPVVNMAFVL